MKRAHRRVHILVWLMLAPALVAIIVFAVMARPGEPANQDLPRILLEEAG